MRVHHLNCATLCPVAGRLVNDERRLVCHCLLVETPGGLVLVDTGLGLADLGDPRGRLGGGFLWVGRPRLDREETAAHQVARLGFRIEDVRHIVVTHLDLDHAGGLGDFPGARVHVHRTEHEAAMARATRLERMRYQPAHWAHAPEWALYDAGGERWMGFECVRDLDDLPPEILLIPLPGHTRGHAAVAVQTGSGWLLHAGDGYFYHGEMNPTAPRCTPGLALFQRIVEIDRAARLHNQQRLRELARSHSEVRVFCAHDPVEFDALAAAQAARSAAQ